jgi:transcriptional regulator with XRE-family HTH domain
MTTQTNIEKVSKPAGAKLREYREKSGLSRLVFAEAIADELGKEVRPTDVEDWETHGLPVTLLPAITATFARLVSDLEVAIDTATAVRVRDPRMLEIGATIKRIREERGLTQTDVGNSINLHYRSYANYEQGIAAVDILKLIQIARYLAVPVSLIIGESSRETADDDDFILDYKSRTPEHKEQLRNVAKAIWSAPNADK